MRLARWALVLAGGVALDAGAQELPPDEIQVTLNGYFDTFDVNILYPTVSATRKVGDSTSLSGRYLVDAITAASIKSTIRVDGITSATSTDRGASEGSPDEVRHELGAGVTQLLWRGTGSANVLRSVEHDYTSNTLALSAAQSFAERNFDLLLGYVRSWDEVYPETRTWRRDKNVATWSVGVSQVLHPRAIGQLEFSYTDIDGFLSDAYQVVTILTPEVESVSLVEPVYPDRRIRRAAGGRVNLMVGEESAVRLGYRRYWDSWDVRSDTFDILVQQNLLERDVTLGLGFRRYLQSNAYFFESTYAEPARYMAVDSKLNAGRSSEGQVRLRVAGNRLGWLPGFGRDDLDLNATVTYYRRRTSSPDWHARRDLLEAVVTSVGVRIRY